MIKRKNIFLTVVIAFLFCHFFPSATSAQETLVDSGYAPVNGLELYYEIHSNGNWSAENLKQASPLILLHGGLGSTGMFYPVMSAYVQNRPVIAVDLQAHGRTADIDRPIRYEHFGDDIAAFIRYLNLGKVDIMGYSMGAGAALRTAIQHPEVVRRLIVVSASFSRDGFFPEILASQDQVNAAAVDQFKNTPMYKSYVSIAPEPDNFPLLLDKMNDLMSRDYNWSEGISGLDMPILLVYADADMFPTSHMASFYELLGGGQRDAGWDGSQRSTAQLAILPNLTHYNIFISPLLATVANQFLEEPVTGGTK